MSSNINSRFVIFSVLFCTCTFFSFGQTKIYYPTVQEGTLRTPPRPQSTASNNQAQSGEYTAFYMIRLVFGVLVVVISLITTTIWFLKWLFRGYSQRRFLNGNSKKHWKDEVALFLQSKNDKEQDFMLKQRQIIRGVRRGSWFLTSIAFCVLIVIITIRDNYHDIIELLLPAILGSTAVFILTHMSIWVLKGFWKKD